MEELYYTCSENKGADQLHSYCEADLHLVFSYAKCFFHDVAHVIFYCLRNNLNNI